MWLGTHSSLFRRSLVRLVSTHSRRYEAVGEYLYGTQSVLAALQANRRVVHALYLKEDSQDRPELNHIQRLAAKKNIAVKMTDKQKMNIFVQDRPHQGVIADASELAVEQIDSLSTADSDNSRMTTHPIALALDMVQDPQNFGAILRSAYFFGIRDVVICSRHSSPLSPAASKASAGALEYMQVRQTSSLPRFLNQSKRNGWFVIGADRHPTAISSAELTVQKPTILVVGSEGEGLRTLVKQSCDQLVEITSAVPPQRLDSLNVSVATGILLDILTRGTRKAAQSSKSAASKPQTDS